MQGVVKILFCVMVGCIALAAQAQAQRGSFKEFLRHKTRWSQEEINRAIRDRVMQGASDKPTSDRRELAASTREAIVSGDNSVESEVHAAINPNDSNNIIVSPIRQGSVQDGLLCPIYYTKDFGATWQKSIFRNIPQVEGQMLTIGGGDPIVAFDYDGTAYLFWLSVYFKNFSTDTVYSGLFWAYSTDGGVSWQQAERDYVALSALTQAGGGNGRFYDKEWVAVDGSSSPFRNSIYMAFMAADPTGESASIEVRKKRAGSMEFDNQSVLVTDGSFDFVQFANIDTDADGKVHVTFLGRHQSDGSQYSLWHAVSSDGGVTFSQPKKISNIRPQGTAFEMLDYTIPGISNDRLYPCPQLAVDKTTGETRGHIYITWTATGIVENKGEGLDVYLARSTNGGATWEAPIIVHDDEREIVRHQFYPSIGVNQQGVVTVTWYDRRNDPQHRNTDYYMAHSFDGGRTFGRNFPVSTQSSNFATVGSRNDEFGIGEYTQVLATPGHAIAVWTDGRGNNGDLNILAGFVPLDRAASGVARLTTVSEKFQLFDPAGLAPESVGFRLEEASPVTLRIFDETGRPVATLADGAFEPGTHHLPLKTASLASGRYFCRLETRFGATVRAFSVVK